ncbi:hypothetical protein OG349_22665 [Streptomyces sp. NBC_01317]|uniref:hypothetical protein n=1 Tax=Streptomyces sp. NBC_01317 TaxID=2903822 RepID=UPI002E13B6CC|nr:hypothetical protein OG349_22665 [Streptomyces sp. NBC_01317]
MSDTGTPADTPAGAHHEADDDRSFSPTMRRIRPLVAAANRRSRGWDPVADRERWELVAEEEPHEVRRKGRP